MSGVEFLNEKEMQQVRVGGDTVKPNTFCSISKESSNLNVPRAFK